MLGAVNLNFYNGARLLRKKYGVVMPGDQHMDEMAIADCRHLRRKVTFWRVAVILLLVAACFAVFGLSGPSVGAIPHAHIARIEISGRINDDSELAERLDAIGGNAQVKGLIVSISSPGGTTYGDERIFKAIRKVAEKSLSCPMYALLQPRQAT